MKVLAEIFGYVAGSYVDVPNSYQQAVWMALCQNALPGTIPSRGMSVLASLI